MEISPPRKYRLSGLPVSKFQTGVEKHCGKVSGSCGDIVFHKDIPTARQRHTHSVPTQPRRRKEDGSEIKIFPGLHLHRPLPVPVHGRVRGHGMGLPAPTGGQRGDVPLQLARRQNRGRGGGLCGILPRYPRPAGGKRRPARRESVAPRGTRKFWKTRTAGCTATSP